MLLASNPKDTELLQDSTKKTDAKAVEIRARTPYLSLLLLSGHKHHICGRLPYYLAVQTYFADSAIPQIRLATKLI